MNGIESSLEHEGPTDSAAGSQPLREDLEEQPILTNPYEEPRQHWKTKDGATENEIVKGRRAPHEPLPIGKTESVQADLFEGEAYIARLRKEVRSWREAGWPGTTSPTRQLLEYWSREPGEGPVHSLFFAQREAIETIVYLTETGGGDHWMVRRLRTVAEGYSRGLLRLAIRMATGTGKTTVMACLIAWYAVNRHGERRHRQGGLAQNVGRIVVICPGKTIQSQLQVLDPMSRDENGDNLYDAKRLVPDSLRQRLSSVKVHVLNWEKLLRREGHAFRDFDIKRKKQTIELAGGDAANAEKESYDDLWSRILGRKRGRDKERVVVLNDEGHHCWERKDGEAPGVWMEALHGLAAHPEFTLEQAVDLSATPIFIQPANSRRPEGEKVPGVAQLVPWVVSEFALMEAMESGLVKIPQPPRGDNRSQESPLRNLYDANGGRTLRNGTQNDGTAMELVRQGAKILYNDYKETFEDWERTDDPRIGRPVLIAVADTKNNARAIYEMLGGSLLDDGRPLEHGMPLLSNLDTPPPQGERKEHTILVLSRTNNPETEEGEQVKGGALGLREVGQGATQDELESVLRTVAQPGKPGQDVRCVVSVGMLTEGWDCQRVTHILGYRKFGSQLLCEQTMGRALRRRDYDNTITVVPLDGAPAEQRFPAEYATVFGVPFEGSRRKGGGGKGELTPKTKIEPVESRKDDLAIWIPDFSGYTTVELSVAIAVDPELVEEIHAKREGEASASTIQWVTTQGPIGIKRKLYSTSNEMYREPIWKLASELTTLLRERLSEEGREREAKRQGLLFARCLAAVNAWLNHDNVRLTEDDLRTDGLRDLAKSAILKTLRDAEGKRIERRGILRNPRNPRRRAGDWRPFETALKEVEPANKSELNASACHTRLERGIARSIENCSLVESFVRNHGPERFEIPYKHHGGWARYVPDFFVRGRPARNGLIPHVIVEGKGQPDEKSEQKAWWTQEWWTQAANALDAGTGNKWAFVEIRPGENVEAAIEAAMKEAVEA